MDYEEFGLLINFGERKVHVKRKLLVSNAASWINRILFIL